MSSSSPVLLSDAPSSSSKLALPLVAGVALLGCQIGAAAAQSKKFPSDLVGSWCSLNHGTHFDISRSELEEGDGACHLRKLKTVKLAVILLAATALASSAVAEQRKGRATTCRGVLTAKSEDTFRLGHCRIQFDHYAGVVEAIARGCKVGDRCTVRARVHDGEITYVYSVARH